MGLSVSQSRAIEEIALNKRQRGQPDKFFQECLKKEYGGEMGKQQPCGRERESKEKICSGEEEWRTGGEKEESNYEKKTMGEDMRSQNKGENSIRQQQRKTTAEKGIYQLPQTPTFGHTSSKQISSSISDPSKGHSILPHISLQPALHTNISSVQSDHHNKSNSLLECASETQSPSSHELASSQATDNVRREEMGELDWRIEDEEHVDGTVLPLGVVMSNKFAEHTRYTDQQAHAEVLTLKNRNLLGGFMPEGRPSLSRTLQMASRCDSQNPLRNNKTDLYPQPST